MGAFFSVGGVFDTSDSGEMYVRMGVFVFLLCYVIRVTLSGDTVLFPWMKPKKSRVAEVESFIVLALY